ncbi:MAG: hypothetical protein JNJ77_07820 [Planctomycetia bacterium]|nr:hypothetical protein [Planctomycetia bacterium]
MNTSLKTAAVRCATINGRMADRVGKHVVDTLARKPYLSMLQLSQLRSHSDGIILPATSRLPGAACLSNHVQENEHPSRMELRNRWLQDSDAKESGYGMQGNGMRIQKTLNPAIFTVV